VETELAAISVRSEYMRITDLVNSFYLFNLNAVRWSCDRDEIQSTFKIDTSSYFAPPAIVWFLEELGRN